MKIVLKELQVDLSSEEAMGPVGQLFSKWVDQTPSPQETCLLPTSEIASHLKMSHEAFRRWLQRDERLQKLACLRDGSLASLGNRAPKYFRLAEVKVIFKLRKQKLIHPQGALYEQKI